MDRGEDAGERAEHRYDLCGGGLWLGIRGALGLRQGGSAVDDAFAGGGMGAAPYPAERDRTGTVSHGRRVVAVDAVDGDAGKGEEASSDGAFWAARRAGRSGGVFAEQAGGLREWRMRGDRWNRRERNSAGCESVVPLP